MHQVPFIWVYGMTHTHGIEPRSPWPLKYLLNYWQHSSYHSLISKCWIKQNYEIRKHWYHWIKIISVYIIILCDRNTSHIFNCYLGEVSKLRQVVMVDSSGYYLPQEPCHRSKINNALINDEININYLNLILFF